MSKTHGYVTVSGARGVRATDKAVLVSIEGDEHWIPQSHIHDDSEVYGAGHEGNLVISRWIAEQKEIDGDEHKG